MKFIVFEGLDGAGKSTLIKKVEERLATGSQRSVFVRDPGGTPVSEKIRQLILDPADNPCAKTEVLLYQASRAQLVHEKIKPSLQKGVWVLSDRFYSSTVAFQCSARGLDRADIDWLSRYACDGLRPDLVIFIDIPVSESRRRVNKRTSATGEEADRIEKENDAFHAKVREGYLSQAQEDPSSWLVLDGLKTPEALFEDVLTFFQEKKWLD